MPSEPLPPRRDQLPKRAATPAPKDYVYPTVADYQREVPKPWSGLSTLAGIMAAFAWLNLAGGLMMAGMFASFVPPPQAATAATVWIMAGVITWLIFLSLASAMRGIVRLEQRAQERT